MTVLIVGVGRISGKGLPRNDAFAAKTTVPGKPVFRFALMFSECVFLLLFAYKLNSNFTSQIVDCKQGRVRHHKCGAVRRSSGGSGIEAKISALPKQETRASAKGDARKRNKTLELYWQG